MRHISNIIAWSLVALFAGTTAIANWYYYQAVKLEIEGITFYGYHLHHNKTTSTNLTSVVSTSDWKTYTNNTYRFSIKYPANWYVTENTDGEGVVIITNFKYPSENGRELIASETKRVISIKDNPNNLSAKQYFATNNSDATIISQKNITIGAASAFKAQVKSELGNLFIVDIPYNNKIIEIVSYANSDNLDQMLSSLQFIK